VYNKYTVLPITQRKLEVKHNKQHIPSLDFTALTTLCELYNTEISRYVTSEIDYYIYRLCVQIFSYFVMLIVVVIVVL
jgi:hypothetical protein